MKPPGGGLRGWVADQASSRPRLAATADRLVRLVEQRRVTRSLSFRPTDRFGHELPQRRELFRRAFHYLRFNGIDGDYAEFGCHGAHTFRMAWHASQLVGYPTRLWAFDTFAGLPEGADDRDRHPQWVQGTMATALDEFHLRCAAAGMPPDAYRTVPGLYADTLQPTADERPETVSFAYVDCDLHSSTRDVLAFLEERLRPSAVVAFDDYYCYAPDGPSGERLAAAEHFCHSRWTLVPYVQFGWGGMSFVVERRGAVPVDARPW